MLPISAGNNGAKLTPISRASLAGDQERNGLQRGRRHSVWASGVKVKVVFTTCWMFSFPLRYHVTQWQVSYRCGFEPWQSELRPLCEKGSTLPADRESMAA